MILLDAKTVIDAIYGRVTNNLKNATITYEVLLELPHLWRGAGGINGLSEGLGMLVVKYDLKAEHLREFLDTLSFMEQYGISYSSASLCRRASQDREVTVLTDDTLLREFVTEVQGDGGYAGRLKTEAARCGIELPMPLCQELVKGRTFKDNIDFDMQVAGLISAAEPLLKKWKATGDA